MSRDYTVPIAGFIALSVMASAVAVYDYRTKQNAKHRADDFSCGYSYGTKDSVAFVSPALASRAEFQLPKYCDDVAELARKAGVVRIVPWLRGPIE